MLENLRTFIENLFKPKEEDISMQYEGIILELMSRIKNLEAEVAELKELMKHQPNAAPASTVESSDDRFESQNSSSGSYIKMTDEMIMACYRSGKDAFEKREKNLGALADRISVGTGMNRNSAFMYICAVKSMLEGTVFKRAISAKAHRMYLNNIYAEYGRVGLARAIHSSRLHAQYKKSCNLPIDAVEDICNEYERKMR